MPIEPVETIEYRKFHIGIYQDEYPFNPREECENLGTMVCWHSRYELGDEQPSETPIEWLRELAQQHLDPDDETDYIENFEKIEEMKTYDELWNILNKHYVYLPLYLFDHSGIAISTTSFNDPWDSGQIGWIYVSKEEAKKEGFNEDKITDILKQEVETYNDFLTGTVYGYMINEIDISCWGFFGMNFEKNGLLDDAKKAIDMEIEAINEEIANINIEEIGEPLTI